MQKAGKIILGIDPGTMVMGHGIISISGGRMRLVEMNVLKLNSRHDNYRRLQHIHDQITHLVKIYKPDELAIEAPFFGKNVQSMLKLGRAQGVAIAAAMSAGLQVTEYSPRKIKQSITGNGNAGKEQVWKMLCHILSLTERPQHWDATDALAVAICHHFQGNIPEATTPKKTSRKKGSWRNFVDSNPGRIIS